MLSKESSRNKAKSYYKSLINSDIKEKSKIILNKIINNKEFVDAKFVGIYYPMSMEIDLLDLLKFKDKIFLFPKINEYNELDFIILEENSKWERNKFNIKEIKSGKISETINLLIVPMLAKNTNGYRLGYGGGYYDKYLSNKKIKTIGVLLDNITLDFKEEKHDIKLDYIISNEE